ncbi:hypothetical protein D3C74_294360 [compost metagenome]
MAAEFEWEDEAFVRSLQDNLKRMSLQSEQDLWRFGNRVVNLAKELVPVDTGRLRSSIQAVMGSDQKGPYVDIGTNVDYGPPVEFGTRFMAAQPFMRPALAEAATKWVSDMTRGG